MVNSKLYVEGGGRKALNRECRKAFGAFLANAGIAPGRVEVEACGLAGTHTRLSGQTHKGA